MNEILSRINENSGIILVILLVLVIIYTILILIWGARQRKMYQRYELFMAGKDAESLEDSLAELMDKVDSLQYEDSVNKDGIRAVNRGQNRGIQKVGVVKYNAFDGMGGKTSFVLTLLDGNGSGVIINVIHSRETCYTYLKEVTDGVSDVELSNEEKASLTLALQKK